VFEVGRGVQGVQGRPQRPGKAVLAFKERQRKEEERVPGTGNQHAGHCNAVSRYARGKPLQTAMGSSAGTPSGQPGYRVLYASAGMPARNW